MRTYASPPSAVRTAIDQIDCTVTGTAAPMPGCLCWGCTTFRALIEVVRVAEAR